MLKNKIVHRFNYLLFRLRIKLILISYVFTQEFLEGIHDLRQHFTLWRQGWKFFVGRPGRPTAGGELNYMSVKLMNLMALYKLKFFFNNIDGLHETFYHFTLWATSVENIPS